MGYNAEAAKWNIVAFFMFALDVAVRYEAAMNTSGTHDASQVARLIKFDKWIIMTDNYYITQSRSYSEDYSQSRVFLMGWMIRVEWRLEGVWINELLENMGYCLCEVNCRDSNNYFIVISSSYNRQMYNIYDDTLFSPKNEGKEYF